ncbi:helix-turn-helix domain-containing protein [Lujinxingia vulgaris]|uniref:Helix-turn-helix domain-containing protein n=1 Tax=Lujinxingia vulgaris TaxID=2600176 RepID=A0A5C6XFQ7_9DELT|nr:AraC family transcriptional regulator [Lujinxingia vulgaris]TXD39293.1 helix-turn-helix domain-containing protein [Lujinxingia vulgaris]
MPTRKPVLRSALEGHKTLVVRHSTEPCERPHHDATVVHDHASLNLVVNGELRVWQGADYRVREGEFLLVPQGAPHGALGAPEAARGVGESWMLAICPSCFAVQGDGLITAAFDEVAAGACAVRRVDPGRLPEVIALFKRLEKELEAQAPHHDLATLGLLALLMTEVQRAAPRPGLASGVTTPPLVTETLGYIERHACEPISLKEVARAMGKSPAYLTTLIRQHTGATVMEWLTRARLSRARQLLLHSDERVEIIAERVGYASASYFHRVFRQAHQVSPGEWRGVHGGGGRRDA